VPVGSARATGGSPDDVSRRSKESETVDGDSVKRIGTGIWVDEETGETFTGGAYRAETPGGRGVKRSIRAALETDDE